jgi:tetratricopeptide (TPR) repeat protein
MILTFIEGNAGHLDKAIEDGHRWGEAVRSSGYWNLSIWIYLNCATCWAYYHRGDLRSALATSQELQHCGEDANDTFVLAGGFYQIGLVKERMGDFQGCVATLMRAIELCEAIPNHLSRVLAGSALGRCYCRTGDIEKSVAVLTQADTYRAAHGARGWEYFLATALFATYLAAAEQDREPQRDEYLRKAEQACRRLFRSAKGYPVCLPEATRLQGIYDWLTGKQTSAQKQWQRSLDLAEEMGMRYDLAMTHLEMGRRLNDREHLEKAEAIFAEIGAEFDLAETRKLLRPPAQGKKA